MTSSHRFARIEKTLDIERVRKATVVVVGTGGSAGLLGNLARCGVRSFVLFDPEVVGPENIARQEHSPHQIGQPKVMAAAELIRRIEPDARVLPVPRDFLAFADDEIDALIGEADLIIAAADKFAVAARVNELALRLNMAALWIGLYAGGGAGEIVFWHSRLAACLRCLMPKRYEAQARAQLAGQSLDPSSEGCTIFDVTLLDSIAGQLALGLLTHGSENRHGRLIEALGDRNLLQVQLDPEWTFQGRALVREQLGVADDNRQFFSWCTIARRDPDGGEPPCPDCRRLRGRGVEMNIPANAFH